MERKRWKRKRKQNAEKKGSNIKKRKHPEKSHRHARKPLTGGGGEPGHLDEGKKKTGS